ncbi:hypothetical protein ACH5RR_003757 [Cinchona calisaya]|uniref:Uncharacterized protein n=1 Tax=Cinchona calisaya TaxID=153742 RepID=A0ABD3AW26_9GENT
MKSWSKEIVIGKEPADLVGPSYEVVRVLEVFKDGDILLLWRDDIWLSQILRRECWINPVFINSSRILMIRGKDLQSRIRGEKHEKYDHQPSSGQQEVVLGFWERGVRFKYLLLRDVRGRPKHMTTVVEEKAIQGQAPSDKKEAPQFYLASSADLRLHSLCLNFAVVRPYNPSSSSIAIALLLLPSNFDAIALVIGFKTLEPSSIWQLRSPIKIFLDFVNVITELRGDGAALEEEQIEYEVEAGGIVQEELNRFEIRVAANLVCPFSIEFYFQKDNNTPVMKLSDLERICPRWMTSSLWFGPRKTKANFGRTTKEWSFKLAPAPSKQVKKTLIPIISFMGKTTVKLLLVLTNPRHVDPVYN